jgi:hypothetical protein
MGSRRRFSLRRKTLRTVVLVVLWIGLLVGEGSVASADQDLFIRYKGSTSSPSPNIVHVGILKRANGERQLRYITFQVTVTCEDGSTSQRQLVLRYRLLDEEGAFSAEVPKNPSGHLLRVEGSIGWGDGAGSLLYNRAELSADGTEAQLCTTGELSWEVDRTGARPY